MTNRRDFLQGATLASAVPLLAELPREAVAALRGDSPFHAVLVDARHAEARSFGARFAARGARVLSVPDGDLTALWLNDIGPAWRVAPVALAGLTTSATLFCLEQLAGAQGLRVVYHAEHVLEPDAATVHALHRQDLTADGLAAVDPLPRGPLWPVVLADRVAAQHRRVPPRTVGPSLAALQPTLPRGADLLTSWIIAPA